MLLQRPKPRRGLKPPPRKHGTHRSAEPCSAQALRHSQPSKDLRFDASAKWRPLKTLTNRFPSPPSPDASGPVSEPARLRNSGLSARTIGGRACRVGRPSQPISPAGNPVWPAPPPTLPEPSRYFTESAGTILMLSMPTRLFGRSGGCVGVVAIFSSTSSPLMSLPNAVYCLSRKRGLP